MIDALTDTYCIIGNPVQHSFSPYLHNAAFHELGLNAVYVAFDVSNVKDAVNGIRALGIKGASVTIPHKLTVMPYLDEIDEIADLVGSVNLIVNKNGRLIGSNTDAYGFFRALSEVTDVSNKKIAVFGSGGVARAVCFALFYYGKPVSLDIYARPEDKNESIELQNHLREKLNLASKLDNPKQINARLRSEWQRDKSDVDIIINATPLGMHPLENLSVLDADEIPANIVAMDVVYTPKETVFLKNALKRGCDCAYGINMLLYQGVKQFEAWTGKKAPIKVMNEVLKKNIFSR